MALETYQFIITGNCAGQFVQNIFHFRMDDASYVNRLLAAKGLIDGWLAANYMDQWTSIVPEEYIVKSLKARRVTNGGGPEYVDISVDGTTGEADDDMQMSGAGPVIIWNTDGGARRVGKTFVPGISTTNVDGGEITETFVATVLAAAETLRVPFPAVGGTTPTCTMCIPRKNDPGTRSLIVQSQVSKDVGQQRRRQLPV